jgi:hypothetical protein
MHRVSRCLAAVLAASALVVPSVAKAQISVFNTLSGWQGAVAAPGLDTFNDLDIGEGFYATPLLRSAGAYSYRASAIEGFVPAGVNVGPPPLSDTWLSNFFIDDVIVFDNFSPTVRGIGAEFFLSNEAGLFQSAGQLRITVVSGAFTSVQTLTNPTTATFTGFTSVGAISSVTVEALGAQATRGFSTVNNFRLGATPTVVIPEPSTYALLATGLAALAAVLRRRRVV